MGSSVHSMGIGALKKLVDTSRQHCDALAAEFEKAHSKEEKSRIAREYDKALKRTQAMQFLLELQERKEWEAGKSR